MSVKKLLTRLSVLLVMLLSCVTTFAQEEEEQEPVTYPQVVGRGTGKFTITVGEPGDIMKLFDTNNPNYEDWALVRQASDLKIISAEGTTVTLSASTNNYDAGSHDLGYLCNREKFSNLTTLDLEKVNVQFADGADYNNSLPRLGLSKIENIVLPVQNGLNIQQDCFARDNYLKSIIIPDYPSGYTYKIGTTAFTDCKNLTRVSLGKGTSSVGGDPIVFPEGTVTADPNGQYWNDNKGGKGVFSGCTSLYSVVLDDDITCLRPEAFKGCTSLEYVKLPDNLTTIGGNCFQGCTSMTTVTIPATMRHWGGNAFADMYNLTDVYLLADDIPLPYGGDQGGPFNWNQTSNFRYEPADPQNPTYSTADYKYKKNAGENINYQMPILHYSGTPESIERYRWTDSQGYHLIDPDGTTWPNNKNIEHFNSAKDKTPEQGGFKDPDDIYKGWKFFLQGNQNLKRDDIIDLDRFTESRWYSVCFPFDLTIDKFQNTFGARAALSEFSGITYDAESQTMTIRFEAPAVEWATNNVILKKNHSYMIHPDKLAEKNGSEISPLQIFNVDNELEHYRLTSVIEQKQAVISAYENYTGLQPSPEYDQLVKDYEQWSKVLDNYQVDAYNELYNTNVWSFTATSEDNDDNTRIRHYFDKDNVMYYFKGNYLDGVQLPKGSYYLGGSIAAGNYGFYYRKSTGSTWTPYTAILVPDEGAETSAPAKVAFDCLEDAVVENAVGQQATAIDTELFVRIPVKSTGKVYNMQGQQIGNKGTEGLPKGLYIVNGKKYIVK